uniref:Transmembrane protein 216 n=1 Tax=Plectus sambesii TaxID=2011161 RepID=A0A914X210_9BILA
MASRVRSLLPYQILLYCNAIYAFFFFLAEILIFIYKALILPYPTGTLIAELLLLVICIAIEALRNFWAQKGNLTETTVYVSFSLLFTAALAGALVYFILYQTYVLMIEVVLFGIQAVFVLLETVLGIVAIASFSKSSPL